MSKTPGFSQGIEMPMRKKQGPAAVDLMRPGPGTAWEDRGTTGPVSAYFKTVLKTFFSPAILLDHLRRPETTNDAKSFALISGAMWVAGIVIYNIFWLYFILPISKGVWEPDVDSMSSYWLTTAGQAAMVGAGVFLWMKLGTRMFTALGGAELKGATPSLVYNCFAYTLGPSLLAVVIPIVVTLLALIVLRWPEVSLQLAIVPIIGWALAGIWIVFNLIVAGKRRLYMKGSSALINPILIGVSALAITTAVYLLSWFIWSKTLEMNGLTHYIPPPPPKFGHPVERQ